MGGAETIVLPQSETERLLALPWVVVLHDDPVNFMNYVTHVIRKVFGYPREKAEHHMLEVHHLGRSQVWSGEREQAEHYVRQLLAHHLHATMEQAGGGE